MATILQPGTYIIPDPPPPQVVTKTKVMFCGLQGGNFQTLWGVGRTKPINNPPIHGSVVQTPGQPSTFQFNPVSIQGDSDNLYCLQRLVTQIDPSLLQNATQFSNSAWIQIDNPVNCQAFEFDLPTPLNAGTMGIQLLPGKPFWSIRAFDYTIKSWRPLGAQTNFDPTLLQKGAVFGGEYTCDGKTIEHKSVTINGTKVNVTYSQSCGVPLEPRFNAAFQLDATGDAKPYKVLLNNFTVTLQ